MRYYTGMMSSRVRRCRASSPHVGRGPLGEAPPLERGGQTRAGSAEASYDAGYRPLVGPALRRRVFVLLQRADNHTGMAAHCAKVPPPVGAGVSAAFADDYTSLGGRAGFSYIGGDPLGGGVVDNALPEW